MFDPYDGVARSQDAEMCVIGAILVDPYKVMPQAIEMLSENDFFIDECQSVFKFACGYFIDGKDIDHVIITAQLGDGYRPFLANCISLMPSASNWMSYAKIVADTARKIRAWDQFLMLGEGLQSTSCTANDCREFAMNICDSLSNESVSDSIGASDGFVSLYSSLQTVPTYYKTGFKKLDSYLAVKPGDFIIVSGAPSGGKTAFTLQVATKMSKRHNVVYFTLETSVNTAMTRLLSNIMGINSRDIQYRTNLDYEKISNAKAIFDSLNLTFVEAAGYSVSQIKAKAIQLNADVIFIDYIGLMSEEGKTEFEQIGNLSRKLHIMSQQSKITTFAIHQINKEGEGSSSLSMRHLKNSNQIAYDADAILLLYGDDPEAERDQLVVPRNIMIDKNKEGQTGICKMVFDKQIQRISEMQMFSHDGGK